MKVSKCILIMRVVQARDETFQILSRYMIAQQKKIVLPKENTFIQ